jgi:hypothetical protein
MSHRTRIGLWAVVAVAVASGTAVATLRINGNQLVESSARLESTITRARRADGAVTAGPRSLVFNLGQGVMGRGQLQGPSNGEGAVAFAIGIGLVFDIANVALNAYCPVTLTGDANNTGSINSADIIHLVNYVFKSGPSPLPCEASGDVNCSGLVTTADVIGMVNYVFKSGPEPCDVCTLIPGIWSCP